MLSILLLSAVIGGAVALCFSFAKDAKKNMAKDMLKMYVGVLFSVAAPVSWYFLAAAHSFDHLHIMPMLWMLPCVPLLSGYIGMCISRMSSLLFISLRRYVHVNQCFGK